MKIDLESPLVIQPDNKIYVENGVVISLKDIILNKIKFSAVALNRVEQDLYKKLIDQAQLEDGNKRLELNDETLEVAKNIIELVPEDNITVQRWIFEAKMPAFITRAVLDILNKD